jgi:hypothetical protein
MVGIDLPYGSDGLFGEAVGEVIAVRTGSQVFEGEDADSEMSQDLFRGGGPRDADLCGEAIAFAGDGSDVTILAAGFAEDAAEGRDVLIEIVLFDRSVWLDGAHQLFFVEHLAVVCNEEDEGIEDLGSERDLVGIAEENSPAGVDAKISELIDVRLGVAQEGLRKLRRLIFRIFQKASVRAKYLGPR